MQARMNHPALVLPGAMQALQGLAKATDAAGLPKRTRELVNLRASQINVWNRLIAATRQVAGFAGR